MEVKDEQHESRKKQLAKFFASANVPKFSGLKADFNRYKTQLTWALQAMGSDELLELKTKSLQAEVIKTDQQARVLVATFKKNRELSNVAVNGISITIPQSRLDQIQQLPVWSRKDILKNVVFQEEKDQHPRAIVEAGVPEKTNQPHVADVWAYLKRQYETVTRAELHALHAELESLKMDGLDIENFLAEMNRVSSAIASCDQPVSDSKKTQLLFQAMPRRFKDVIGHLEYDKKTYDESVEVLRGVIKNEVAHEAQESKEKPRKN